MQQHTDGYLTCRRGQQNLYTVSQGGLVGRKTTMRPKLNGSLLESDIDTRQFGFGLMVVRILGNNYATNKTPEWAALNVGG